MFKLERQKSTSTPYVLIDESAGYMQFLGESFPENVTSFYGEITEWLKGFLKTDFEKLVFDCELVYFNSSTSKLLMNILDMMDQAAGDGKDITVNWICSPDNDIIIECGEEFAEDFLDVKFKLIYK